MELTISCKTGCLYKRTQLQLSFELLSFGGIYRHFSDKSASLFLVSQSCRDKPTLSRLFFSIDEIGAPRLEGDVRNHVQILLTAIFVCLTDNIIREDYRPVISTSLHEMSDVLIDNVPYIVVGFQSVLVADVENCRLNHSIDQGLVRFGNFLRFCLDKNNIWHQIHVQLLTKLDVRFVIQATMHLNALATDQILHTESPTRRVQTNLESHGVKIDVPEFEELSCHVFIFDFIGQGQALRILCDFLSHFEARVHLCLKLFREDESIFVEVMVKLFPHFHVRTPMDQFPQQELIKHVQEIIVVDRVHLGANYLFHFLIEGSIADLQILESSRSMQHEVNASILSDCQNRWGLIFTGLLQSLHSWVNSATF